MESKQIKEITIRVSDEEIQVYTVSLDYNREKTKLQSSIARILQRVLRTYKFSDSKDTIFDNEDYILLGKFLCQILLSKSVQGIMKLALNDIIDVEKKTLKQRCRIYLEFEPDTHEELALLPWEYTWTDFEDLKEIEPSFLAADLQGQFDLIRRIKESDLLFKPLTVDSQCVYSRGEDGVIRFEEFSKKKILIIFVVTKLQKLDTAPLDKVENYFKNKNFIVEEMVNPTYGSFGVDLDKILDAHKADTCGFIIHYYGHAKVEGEEGTISLMNQDSDDHDWITDLQFADFFQFPNRRPLIMVLQACSSGQINKYLKNEKRGIALNLALKDIPAVVAMQNDVNIKDSFAFINIFYQALLQGDDVAEAVTKGRQYLGSKYLEQNKKTKYSTNAFGAPILFISTKTPIRLFAEPDLVEVNQSLPSDDYRLEKMAPLAALNEQRQATESPAAEKAGRPEAATSSQMMNVDLQSKLD